jgi:hypothetical protein
VNAPGIRRGPRDLSGIAVWASVAWPLQLVVGGDASERGGGMQRVPLPVGGAEPAERLQGLRQAPQQDIVQVPRTQRLPRRWRLHPRWPPGVCTKHDIYILTCCTIDVLVKCSGTQVTQ